MTARAAILAPRSTARKKLENLHDCIARVESLSKLYQQDSSARRAFLDALDNLRCAASGVRKERGHHDET